MVHGGILAINFFLTVEPRIFHYKVAFSVFNLTFHVQVFNCKVLPLIFHFVKHFGFQLRSTFFLQFLPNEQKTTKIRAYSMMKWIIYTFQNTRSCFCTQSLSVHEFMVKDTSWFQYQNLSLTWILPLFHTFCKQMVEISMYDTKNTPLLYKYKIKRGCWSSIFTKSC